jgi:lipopolysaccharide export system protein LptA
VRRRRALLLALLVLTAALAAPRPGMAQGLGLTAPNDRRPLDVEADGGLEIRQNDNVYIARGNARATRGNASIHADTLVAHYRNSAADKPKDKDALTGSTEIYRIEADGNVRMMNETQTVYGDHAVYDIDTATAVVTGKNLKLVTPRDTVTARDSLEWYDNKQIAVARGDALAVQAAKRLSGDVLVAQVVKPADQPSRISRIDAQGHVVVTTINEIARAASGVYNVDTGIATLTGGVTLTRGESVGQGEYAVVDLNTNVSRLMKTAPGSPAAGNAGRGGPVHGLVVPHPAAKPPAPPRP